MRTEGDVSAGLGAEELNAPAGEAGVRAGGWE
jgi:hypothetical protein